MSTSERKTQFPPGSRANPGHHDILTHKEKEKFIRNPARGPKQKKSKAKGKE